jgi:hypothetical protein
MTAPRRRWFRFAFSLRTLLVVVTLFGCWLGWELHVVRKRQSLIDSLPCDRAMNIAEPLRPGFGHSEAQAKAMAQVPLVRRLMGDFGLAELNLFCEIDADYFLQLEAWFPEAEISATIDRGSTTEHWRHGKLVWSHRRIDIDVGSGGDPDSSAAPNAGPP